MGLPRVRVPTTNRHPQIRQVLCSKEVVMAKRKITIYLAIQICSLNTTNAASRNILVLNDCLPSGQ